MKKTETVACLIAWRVVGCSCLLALASLPSCAPPASPAGASGPGAAGATPGLTSPAPAARAGQARPAGGAGCDPCQKAEWSYIWIANTSEGTVSKINTRTLKEEGRYFTGGISPSRTSVSVDGKAVVVANRGGGLVKIWARPELCKGTRTSSGSQPLPWGTDDCVAWFRPFPEATVQRPVQWTSGSYDPGTCEWVDQKVWTVTGRNGSSPTTCDPQGGVWVHLLSGATGEVEKTIPIPPADFPCAGFGAYGATTDGEGNLWFQGFVNQRIIRVDFKTSKVSAYPGGGYGITFGTDGGVWFSSGMGSPAVSKLLPKDSTWSTAPASTMGGIAEGADQRMWAADTSGVVWIDMQTMKVGDRVQLPNGLPAKGLSFDIDSYLWAIPMGSTEAYRINPKTYEIATFSGLNNPYSYSDMTGGQLRGMNCERPPFVPVD